MLCITGLLLAGALASYAAPPDDRRDIELVVASADELDVAAWPVVDQLDEGDVLVVRVEGGEPGMTGSVEQCTATASVTRRCWNSFPVTFDGDRRARFQYQVESRDLCTPNTGCIVRVTADDRVAHVATVFGADAPPPPTVTVTPAGPLAPGARATVVVAEAPPRSGISVVLCAQRCAGGEKVVTANDAGRAALSFIVAEGCRPCRAVVAAGSVRVVVALEVTPASAVRYAPARIFVGLAAAALLLVAAWRLIATVDWRPPGEAAVADTDAFGPS